MGAQLDGKCHLLLVYFQQILTEDVAMMTYMPVKVHFREERCSLNPTPRVYMYIYVTLAIVTAFTLGL